MRRSWRSPEACPGRVAVSASSRPVSPSWRRMRSAPLPSPLLDHPARGVGFKGLPVHRPGRGPRPHRVLQLQQVPPAVVDAPHAAVREGRRLPRRVERLEHPPMLVVGGALPVGRAAVGGGDVPDPAQTVVRMGALVAGHRLRRLVDPAQPVCPVPGPGRPQLKAAPEPCSRRAVTRPRPSCANVA